MKNNRDSVYKLRVNFSNLLLTDLQLSVEDTLEKCQAEIILEFNMFHVLDILKFYMREREKKSQ